MRGDAGRGSSINYLLNVPIPTRILPAVEPVR